MVDVKSLPNGANQIVTVPYIGSTQAGTPVAPTPINPYSTLSVPPYWRAINFLADNLAAFPRHVRRDGVKIGGKQRRHPLSYLLERRPNAVQNATVFWRTLFFHAAHWGNGYAAIRRAVGGVTPTALYNMLPEDVWPFRWQAGGELFAGYYHYPTRQTLAADDVIHIQRLSHDGISGIDPIKLHGPTFQRAATQTKFMTLYLQRGTVIRGTIEIPTGVDKGQKDQLRLELDRHFAGIVGDGAKRDMLILSDGATLKNQTVGMAESGLDQQARWTVKEIAQITGVPPHFLYEFAEGRSYNNAEQMGLDVVRYTFRPWIEQIDDELTCKLLTNAEQDRGLTVGLNADALLRGDTTTQTASLVSQTNAGIRTPNESRGELGLEQLTNDPEANAIRRVGNTSPGGRPTGNPPAGDGAGNGSDQTGNANQ